MERDTDNGHDEDEVSDKEDSPALADSKKYSERSVGTEEERAEEAAEFDEGGISDLDGEFMSVRVPQDIDTIN